MKARIFLAAVFVLGLFLLIAGATSGAEVRAVNVIDYSITENNYLDVEAYVSYYGLFPPKSVSVKLSVGYFRQIPIYETVVKTGGTYVEFERVNLPHFGPGANVEIVDRKGNNIPPIVFGSILTAAAIALFVVNEVRIRKRAKATLNNAEKAKV